ncbi:MAG: stage II sporulation protein M [Rufibacter sp.]
MRVNKSPGMREAAFIKQNSAKWKRYSSEPTHNPDELADRFIELTDDLSFARTFYPDSDNTGYLNSLTGKIHQDIYRNKKEKSNRFVLFWKQELPLLFGQHQRQLLYSFLVFAAACFIGAVSAANDDSFVRLIMGDKYVNMTIANIKKGDPMAVYKTMNETPMFLYITINNIYVAFVTFVYGVLLSLGTMTKLLQTGIMVGTFQYFFYKYEMLTTSVLTIWIHGTLEISAIIIAGCAGFVMGNSILFPKTYSRLESFRRGAKQGLKMVIGLVPIFIAAGFLEGFVTRHTDMPLFLSLSIILGSAAFIIFYFIYYPYRLNARFTDETPSH